jgi:hypothetical protein
MRVRGTPSRSLFIVSVLALAAALVVGVAQSSAKTTNLVPNSGFEAGSGVPAVPDDWLPLPGTTMIQDPTNPHSGSASMQLSGPGAPFGISATTTQSICIKVHPGAHGASFWYRTSDSVATNVIFSAVYYPNPTCSVATFAFDQLNVLPNPDGAWHQVSGTLAAPPGTGSAFFSLGESCEGCLDTVLTANFDDVVFENHR